MKYFIAGGCGFIGSHIIHNLLKNQPDCDIIAYDNLSSGKLKFLKDIENNPRLKIIIGDIKNLYHLADVMRNSDIVIHLASNPDIAKAAKNPSIDFWEGTYLTQNILEAMRVNRIHKILYASGSGIYGDSGSIILNEDYPFKLPVSTYAASKIAGEAMICAYCYRFDMKGRAYRFANAVGQNQTHGVAYDFIQKLKKDPTRLQILGNGLQSKAYVYIDDIISSIYATVDSKYTFDYFNVAPDDYITVNEIAKIVINKMNLSKVKIEYTGGDVGWAGDIRMVRFNTDKIKSFGWKAEYTSQQAIEKSVELMLGE